MNHTIKNRALILLLVIIPMVCAAQPVIKKIEFSGLQKVEEDFVRSKLTLKEGEEYSPGIVNDQIKELYMTGRFASIEELRKPVEDGVILEFVFKENPLIEDIVIFGNQRFKTERIKNNLPISTGDFLPINFETIIRTKITQLYAEENVYRTQINVTTTSGKEEGTIIVSIYIDEGEKLLIKDLRFEGNESFSGMRLRLLVVNRGSWWFLKRYYNEDTFREDLDAIRQLYLSYGFLDVEVERGTFEYNREEGWVCPVIRIKEGKRYIVSDIDLLGYRIFRRDEILRVLQPLQGHYFSSKRLQKSFAKLHKMYGDEGFILMEVKYDFLKDQDAGTVKLTFNIIENQRMYVGDIKVEKREEFEIPEDMNWIERWYYRVAPPVKEEVIQREVVLSTGDVYRRFKEERTIERLKRLGIFEDVAVRREPTDKPDTMNMVVSVKEGITQALLFGIGYGDVSGAYFQARYRERNLFGEARDLDLNVLLGTELTAFHIGYMDRYFRGSQNSFAIELYRDLFNRKEYDETNTGARVTVGFPDGEYLRHYLRFRGEYVEFDDVDDDIEEDLDSYPVMSVRYSLFHDTRDDIGWPTRGEVKNAGLEIGYADGTLVKLTGGYDGYWRLYKDLIFALNTEAGIMPYDADKIGISERFFMGGSTDLRGFKYRGAGPHDPGDDDVPTGGAIKFLARNELRFPIYEKLRGLVFLDVGTIDDEFFGLGEPRASAGVGFRMDVKVFYIAVDFAHAFLEEDDDETQFFHFRLGSLF